jgi:hypothetical protein
MARNGYLILDSDLHMMEPDDLWARYLDEPYRANPPRFFGGQKENLPEKSDDKGNADNIMGMEVQGLAIPAHATCSRRHRVEPRVAPPQPCPAPAFPGCAGARLRCDLDPGGNGYRGHRRRGHVWHARPPDPVS